MRSIFSFSFAAILFLAGCGAQDAIDATNSMPEKMDSMNEAVRLQKLAVLKENLENEDNARVLLPVPTDLMGYAKKFAETANAEELVSQVYLYLKNVNDGMFIPKVDETGSDLPFTPQEISENNQYKLHRYIIAQAVSAFIPKVVLEQIIREQIVGELRYKKTAREMLMMRFTFHRDVLLNASILSETFDGVGTLEKAMEYVTDMEYVANLPFASQIAVKTFGFASPFPNVDESLANGSARVAISEILNTIKTRSDVLIGVQMADVTGNSVLNQVAYQDQQRRLKLSLESLDKKIAVWK